VFDQSELNMRQRRWMELLSDYDCEIRYHPGKANVVADALSRKERVKPRIARAMSIVVAPSIRDLILEAQAKAVLPENFIKEGLNGLEQHFDRKNDNGLYLVDRIWVPVLGGLRTLLLREAHNSGYSIHPGSDKMYFDLRDLYWWPGMKKDVAQYVSECVTCLQVKAEHKKPPGLLVQPEIPVKKWEHITMDFITKLPRTRRGNDMIWVIVDRLTKSAHFLPLSESDKFEAMAKIYLREVVTKHGVPVSIISDRDSRYTSHIWKQFQSYLGTKLNLSTAFHPQTDGQSERTIQTLEDMLRACAIEFSGSWDDHLPLCEFSYNNSYHASIGMAPFRALYGEKCRSPLNWAEVGLSQMVGPEYIVETTKVISQVKEKLRVARERQEKHANVRRRPLEFKVGDHVLLKVSPWKGVVRFVKRGKLGPRYIGPFKILETIGKVAYRLELPAELSGVHDVFHVSNLRKCLAEPTRVVPLKEIRVKSNLKFVEEPVEIVGREERKLKNKRYTLVKVRWQARRGAEFTFLFDKPSTS
jgi:Integrase zinc binding domain